MKVYAQTTVGPNFVADLQFKINPPSSGFSFCLGSGTGASNFVTGLAFSGYNGYIFDQSGNFFGGYRSGQRFDLQIHGFSELRASYFFNGVLMANDIGMNCGINCLEFDKIGQSSVFAQMSSEYLIEEDERDGITYNNSSIFYNGQTILFTNS